MSTGKCPHALFYDLGGILKPWTIRTGVAMRDMGQVRTVYSGGTEHHLSVDSSCHRNALLKSTCTLSPRRVLFLAQCTSNALQGKMQSVAPIFERIIAAKSWNLCHAADLWDIRQCIIKILWSPYNLFLVFFFIKLFPRELCRITEFQSWRPFGITEIECQDSGQGRCSLPN